MWAATIWITAPKFRCADPMRISSIWNTPNGNAPIASISCWSLSLAVASPPFCLPISSFAPVHSADWHRSLPHGPHDTTAGWSNSLSLRASTWRSPSYFNHDNNQNAQNAACSRWLYSYVRTRNLRHPLQFNCVARHCFGNGPLVLLVVFMYLFGEHAQTR